ncbi:MAG: thiolase family protein [Hyphomicrobiales bacterium]|nr:thiolase family protein [Hyphomicrobiales bacterium]
MSALIIAARRSAIGRIGGMHRARAIEALTAPLINALLQQTGLEPARVDEVILGNAAGGGGNPARLALLHAGLPDSVPGITVDRQCASGLDAILMAARMIETGAADVVIAGGAESPSTAPWRIAKPQSLYRCLPQFFERPAFSPESIGDPTMAEAAEAVASERGISRAAQDGYALESWRRAAAAQAAGRFQQEILPVAAGEAEARDECVRPHLTAELLARIPSLIPTEGTVTAGNTCQICDGAALTLIISPRLWGEMGKPPALRVLGGAAAGVHPMRLGLGPIPAVRKLFSRFRGASIADVGAVEFNEAFASQVIASLDELKLDRSIVNTGGGALAFGHPYGASGAVLAVRLFIRMVSHQSRNDAPLGLAMLGAAGGLGVAALFEHT